MGYSDDEGKEYWIEGVGSTTYGPYFFGAHDSYSFDLRWLGVMSVYDGETCVFERKDFQKEEYRYHPFVVEGKTWNCANVPANVNTPEDLLQNPYGKSTYTIAGDTVINDVAYKKVLCQDEYFYGDAEFHYYSAVREEKKKVYSIENEMAKEALLYDFSSSEETIPLTYGDLTFYRHAPYTKEFANGESRYIYYLGDAEGSYVKTTWVEAVGCLDEPFSFAVYSFPDTFMSEAGDVPYYRRNVMSCEENGKTIFRLDDLSEPTSVSSVKTIPVNREYFDLQGRRLNGKPQQGVYIQEGKKRFVR